MKKLKLSRETLSVLNSSDLGAVHGGGTISIIIVQTAACPIPTLAGCTGGPCVMTGGGGTVGSCTSECGGTVLTPGTSVINPGGGF